MTPITNQLISIVIPVLNETESLAILHGEITAVAAEHDLDVEVLFIDDGSFDGSWQEIEKLHAADPRVTGIRFRRTFGKTAALAAGFAHASGSRVITLDADLQDDPKEIPRMLQKLSEGHDVVSGWKSNRQDPWHKTMPSKVFNWLVGTMTGVRLHDHNCGFKAYRAEVLKEISLYGEFHRFMPVLADARGFRVTEIPVHHRSRKYGHSKYGYKRFLRGFLDLLTVKFLTSYQSRPQHLVGAIGLAALGLGTLGMTYLSIVWILTRFGAEYAPIGNRPLLLFSSTAMLFGVQLICMGLLAELITAREHKEGAWYGIAKTLTSSKVARDLKSN